MIVLDAIICELHLCRFLETTSMFVTLFSVSK